MKVIEPLLRNKRRTILLMGGNYEEVNKETKEIIVKFMISTPSVVQTSKDLGGAIPIIAKPTEKKDEVEAPRATTLSKAPFAEVGKDTEMTESTL